MKKTNRTFKRFAAITSASLLAACALMPAVSFADDPATYTITITNDAKNHTYEAYQIFTGDLSVEGTAPNTTKVLSNIKWGADVTEYDGGTVTLGSDASEIAKGLSNSNIKAFIGKLNLDDEPIKTVTSTTGGSYVINGLAPGYYLIKDAESSLTGYDAYTSYIVEVVGDTTAEPKGTLPTVQKKVYEDQDANKAAESATHEATTELKWNDVADYDIGDEVPFKLYGTLPDNLDDYTAYYYKFSDSLGTEFDTPTQLTIDVCGSKTFTATRNGDNWTVTGEDNDGISVVKNGNGFNVIFANIKNNGAAANGLVTITYNAKLNANAVVGKTGQKNTVDLTYSNNPYDGYDGTSSTTPNTGETPDDEVIVHTYALKLDKEFYNRDSEIPLTPDVIANDVYTEAEFSLFKGQEELYFLPCTDENYDYVLAKSGDTVTIDGNEYTATTQLKLVQLDNNTPGNEKDDNLVIRIKGLDEGSYTLKEDVVPTGFNKAPDQPINIDATTANSQQWEDGTASLTKFEYTVGEGNDAEKETQEGNAITAEALAIMENRQGSSLPSTGGIGTTIFYLGGGAMAAIGGIYLISKRRMKKSEE
ncbi:MAG: isopeptide-forming domain-containing fimbrial protein [Ruminococcus sp.]|nr:isopeptide-forming domain-containing fimbrial protein [Ruminococcus sp.]